MLRAAVLLLTLTATARAEEDTGILATIRNGLSNAGAAISSFVTEPGTAPYTPGKTYDTFEMRTYPARKWVCTKQTTEDEDVSRRVPFMKLYGYITGDNDKSQSMDMTSPVTMLWQPADGSARTLTMCFFVNEEFQEDTPVPSGPTVFLEERPQLTAIAARESGYMSEEDWENLAAKLKQDAIAEGLNEFDFSQYYRAGYDSPMKFWNRRNEVWYVNA